MATPVKKKDAVRNGVKFVRACTIRKPAEELYAFWRKVENLGLLMGREVVITPLSETESRWSVTGPPGKRRAEWEAVITGEEPNRFIAWESRPGADVAHEGAVHFVPAPGDEGIEVTVTVSYDPPGGKAAVKLIKLSPHDPAQQVATALRRFKALMEAGEIPTTEGQPVGEPQRKKKR